MPRFSYEAFDASGQISGGDLDATSEAAALHALAAMGVTPISLESGTTKDPWWAREISLTGATPAHKPIEIERFFATFASLLAANLPLCASLRFCANQSHDLRMQRSLGRIALSVENGSTLRDAMNDENGLFAERLVTLVGIAEASNTLSETAQRIAELLNAEAFLYHEIRGAMVYPIILLTTAALVMAVLVFYLVPTLTPVFVSAGADIPLPLKVMLVLRSLAIDYWFIIFALATCLGGAFLFARKALYAASATAMRCFPIVGRMIVQHATLEICRNLHLMLSSGARLTTAIATARDAARIRGNAELMDHALREVQAGALLSDHLCSAKGFDPVAAAMIRAGEQSDQLTVVLGRIATDLNQQSARTLKQVVQLITPIITLLIGGGIGIVVLSTISAIMDLNELAF
ncbi:type II secretion system F family protein [Tateyamaria omphalii]|uniref:type II secretion system F family protein n=1 Tax=Tateyamaria omphalii TaxID=299262 RepID=UPI001C98F2B5|nr:type II secretion system F family protein [Tateyamaria omphalii]MBY5934928.1 type II secretion system F family protein [Tateyamaria omphalii]